MKEPKSSDTCARPKRPERPLYVPPAQRHRNVQQKPVKSQKCNVIPTTESVCDLLDKYFCQHAFPIYKSDRLNHPHDACPFAKLLHFQRLDNTIHYGQTIKLYERKSIFFSDVYQLDMFHLTYKSHGVNYGAYPFFDLIYTEIADRTEQTALLIPEFEAKLIEPYTENKAHCVYRKLCDVDCIYLNLDHINGGHWLLITSERNYFFYECSKDHDLESCAISVVERTKEEKHKKVKIERKPVTLKKPLKLDKTNNEHDKEKEIMLRTQENINRRTKPIMKYIQYKTEALEIDKGDGVSNWEDLVEDDSPLHQELFTEYHAEVSEHSDSEEHCDDNNSSRLSSHLNETLEHIVELYDFPSSLETCHLIQAYSDLNNDSMYVKWVDDTHALLVLGSLTQAQRALTIKHSLIKARDMTAATSASIKVAIKSNLKPAMKRPPTNLQTARRLITTHLGRKSSITKEQSDKEKQDLKLAREQKRLIRQSQADAWEGKVRSTIN